MEGPGGVIAWIVAEYRRYKSLGEGAIRQLGPDELVARASPRSNSVATIVWHVAGNLESRFTDFLTSDGEKPWRHRDSEFDERMVGRQELLAKWERGWRALFEALEPLVDEDLHRTVSIRGVELTVGEALVRSLAHTSYHVGQMTFSGKAMRGEDWEYLSIPPGGSVAYNLDPTMEKGPA
ncbi:MAG TPA: DinB family protein [Longimicrobiales bacterium]|nr:DinB family protein [Longimicrobiales bacterium]